MTRNTNDGPFCWQNKTARRKIREAFDTTHNVATALGVYDALTEIASDSGTDQFKTTHAWIAQLSGVSPSSIKKVLGALAEIGLVTFSTPKLRAPSCYTLLPIANGCLALANGCLALANSPLSGGWLDQKKSEESLKNVASRRSRFVAPNGDEWIAYARQIGWARSDAEGAFDHYVANGWVQGRGKPIRNWQAAARNCKRRGHAEAKPDQPLRMISA